MWPLLPVSGSIRAGFGNVMPPFLGGRERIFFGKRLPRGLGRPAVGAQPVQFRVMKRDLESGAVGEFVKCAFEAALGQVEGSRTVRAEKMVMVRPVRTDEFESDVFVVHHHGMNDAGLAELLHHPIDGGRVHPVGSDELSQLRLRQGFGVGGQGAKHLEPVRGYPKAVLTQGGSKFPFDSPVVRQGHPPFSPWPSVPPLTSPVGYYYIGGAVYVQL